MMAVFMVNICKFDGCGIVFQGLGDLIQHIEESHIDYDPHVIEKQEAQHPVSLPLSYVLRFITDAARKEFPEVKPKAKPVVQNVPGQMPNNKHVSSSSVQKGVSPPVGHLSGSDGDEDDMLSDSDSNDSWTTPEEFSSEYILRYGSRSSAASPTNPNQNPEKPFACPVPGCKKRYKNVNGIKYHSKNGHKNDGKIRKGFKCHCGKSYKSPQGLKIHTAIHHSGSNLTTVTTQMGEILQIPARDAALSPLRAVTLKPIVTATGLNVSAINGTIGLPVKTLQGVVVATKSLDGTTAQLKGSVIEANGFNLAATLAAKASAVATHTNNGNRSHVSALITPQKAAGLFINTLNIASSQISGSTEQASSGILTPATSPQTPPLTPDGQATKVVMSLTSPHSTTQLPVSLPLTPVSPANTPPLALVEQHPL